MLCWRCGRPVREGAKVCVHCGARLSDPPQPARDDRRDGGRAARRPLEEERPSRSRGGRAYDEPDGGDDQEIERPPRSSRPRTRDDDHRPDPLDDPRAPNALRRGGPPTPPSRGGPGRGGRSGRADRPQRPDPPADRYDDQQRGAGGYGRGGRERDAGRAYDREPPPARGSNRRDPYERDGGGRPPARNQGRGTRMPARQGESAEYETPSAEYDAALSAEYSAAYSAELSAEYSAEYGAENSAEYSAEYNAEYRAGGGNRGPRRGYPEDDPYAGGRGRERGGRGMGSGAGRRRGVYPEAAPARAGYNSWEARALATAGGAEGGEGWTSDWQAAEARPARKKRRRGGVIAAVLLLLLLVAVLGAGFAKRDAIFARLGRGSPTPSAFATYTPGPTPTVPPQYKQFVSPKGQYILVYPQAWTVKSDSTPSGGMPDYVDTFSQATPAVVVAVEQAQIFNTLSDADAIAAEIRAAQQKGYTFTPTGTPTTVSVGGEQWQRQEYDSTTNGVKLHYAVLSTHHQGRSYVIVLVALPGDFAKENASTFPAILKSFRFTG